MKDKGSLYIGAMLVLLGLLFLLVNIGATLLPNWSILHMGRLWPLLIVWLGLGFYLPIFIWWDSRLKNYGLAMPGAIILVNGLVLLYCSLTGRWGDWIFLWTLEPFSIGLGLLTMYILGPKHSGLLIAGLIICAVSLALFAILVSALGFAMGGIVGAGLLILLGLLMVIRSLIRPAASKIE